MNKITTIVCIMTIFIVVLFGGVVINEQNKQICNLCEKSNFTAHISHENSDVELYCDKWGTKCKELKK